MSEVKITFIGAGSFVFGPAVLAGVLRHHDLGPCELALVDVDADALGLMAAVARRVAATQRPQLRVTEHTHHDTALPGSDFVIHCAAPQLQSRHRTDRQIIERHAPDHLVTEFGGIAGLSYSLRQIAFIRSICEAVSRHCPKAWLLCAANPLPRVCEAAHRLGVRTAGFCNASLTGYRLVERAMTDAPPPDTLTPFDALRRRFELLIAGVNHLTWIIAARDVASGDDLMPALRRARDMGRRLGEPRSEQLLAETGYLTVCGDRHIQDFLPPPDAAPPRHDPWHGKAEERTRRREQLAAVAEGREPFDNLHLAWEKPIDLVAGIVFGRDVPLHALNLANDGQIPQLPRGCMVETPAVAGSGGPAPQVVQLPPSVAALCRPTAELTSLIVRAALEQRRTLVHDVVDRDPTITDKAAGRTAADAVLEAHADMIGSFT
jgi:alpha-galactosidase